MSDRITDTGAGHGAVGYASPQTAASATVMTPTDRVRWGPIIAGLFTALSTLALLGVLGLAVGFSSYDAQDRLRNFGIGAGVWGAISALAAFFIGGLVAARTAAVAGRNNGAWQGAMVWVVAIPMLLYLLTSIVGSAARTTASAAGQAAQTTATAGAAAADAANAAADADPDAAQQASAKLPSGQEMQSAAQDAAQQVRDKVSQVATPQNAEAASEDAAKGAWGTLISMVLGLVAATVGGLLGARDPARHHTTAGAH